MRLRDYQICSDDSRDFLTFTPTPSRKKGGLKSANKNVVEQNVIKTSDQRYWFRFGLEQTKIGSGFGLRLVDHRLSSMVG